MLKIIFLFWTGHKIKIPKISSATTPIFEVGDQVENIVNDKISA